MISARPGKVEQIVRSYESSGECGSVVRCPVRFGDQLQSNVHFFCKSKECIFSVFVVQVLMTGTQVFCDAFSPLLFISHFCTTLTLCSRFCGAPVLFLRQRTTAYKGPYDELMISLEITSLSGFLKYSSSVYHAAECLSAARWSSPPNIHPVLFA